MFVDFHVTRNFREAREAREEGLLRIATGRVGGEVKL